MMSVAIEIVGLLLSSLVSVSIVFDFLDTLFDRLYADRKIYNIVKSVFIIILAGINSLDNVWINLISVVIISELISIKLYVGDRNKIFVYLIILIVCMGACESIGIVLLHLIYYALNITIESVQMRSLFDITTTQLLVIFINHLVILQIMKRKKINDLTNQQYLITFIYTIFSIANIYILSLLLNKTSTESEIILVLFTIVGIIFTNSHLLKILEFASENNRLQYENNLFLQQSRMQYQYYDNLESQYRESLSIIHDAKRHIRAIEELYNHKEIETATLYSRNITEKLDSFQINEYTDNRVLNIILNDKMRLSEQNNIQFTCKIEDVDLQFIDNIDLTTIFANLLDNAIEACLDLQGEKLIILQVGAFNNLIVINIKNTMDETVSDMGIIMKTNKKNHSGIGIPNVMKVVNKYNGDFNIQKEGNMFVCSIVLSRKGRREM